MLKIRRNTFETNSSSMHSLVLRNTTDVTSDEEVKKDFIDKLKDVNGKLYLFVDPETFDHGFSLVTDAKERFLYLMAGCRTIHDIIVIRDALKKKFLSIDKNIGEKFTGFIFKYEDDDDYYFGSGRTVKQTLDIPGLEIEPIEVNEYQVFFNTGEIDHQSSDLPAESIHSVNVDSVASAEEIIFSNKYLFVIDSDSNEPFIPKSIAAGIYKKEAFTAILKTFYPIHDEVGDDGKVSKRTDYSHSFPVWKDIDDVLKAYEKDYSED